MSFNGSSVIPDVHWQTGSADIPTSKVIEKQKVVIDQMKYKLHVEDFEHFDQLRYVLFVDHIRSLTIVSSSAVSSYFVGLFSVLAAGSIANGKALV